MTTQYKDQVSVEPDNEQAIRDTLRYLEPGERLAVRCEDGKNRQLTVDETEMRQREFTVHGKAGFHLRVTARGRVDGGTGKKSSQACHETAHQWERTYLYAPPASGSPGTDRHQIHTIRPY